MSPGLSEPEFFEYFSGKENRYAIRIDELEEFAEPVDPYAMFMRFVPPQSFCYLDSLYSSNLLVVSQDRLKLLCR
jgi:type I restriction enzyme, S subunit